MRLVMVCLIGSLLAGCCGHSVRQPRIVFTPAPEQGIITRWIDGDTCVIEVESGDGMTWKERVRLYGINAPELREPGGPEARAEMIETWPVGSRTRLEYPERIKGRIVYRGSFGRLLATIHKIHGREEQ